MQTASILAFLLGVSLLSAQEPAPKINKVGAAPTSPASGKEMYRSYCASCHGADGKGNGPAASAFKMPPSDLTTLAKKNGGKYPSLQVMNSIKDGGNGGHGSKEMPVWGPILSSVSADPGVVGQRVSNLVSYIQSIQVK
jgi:mono/diheme cytochrome c family protein